MLAHVHRLIQLTSAFRGDGWQNVISGLGTAKDKRTYTRHSALGEIPYVELEGIYERDGLGARVVDLVALDMLREGFEVRFGEGTREEAEKDIHRELRRLHWRRVFTDALCQARLYGGAGIILGLDDGATSMAMPLRPENVKAVRFLVVAHRWELVPMRWDDDLSSENHGRPVVYTYQPTSGRNVVIHHSRILRFDTTRISRSIARDRYDGWGPSVLQRAHDAVANFATQFNAAASIAHDFTVDVYKLKNLAALMASNGEEQVKSRLEITNFCKSVLNAIPLDSEEEYTRQTTSLAGLGDLQKGAILHLAAVIGFPVRLLVGSKIFGGLGEGGDDADLERYYSMVAQEQELGGLREGMERLISLIQLAQKGPFAGVEAEDWELEFNPLWTLDEKTRSEIRESNARADVTYIREGVLDPQEVRESRFTDAGYGDEITLIEGVNPSEDLENDDEDLDPDEQPEPDE